MTQTLILVFLIGAVISWGLRVFVLIPITFLLLVGVIAFGLYRDEYVLTAVGHGVLVAIVPQLGYAFGLMVRSVLAGVRTPRKVAQRSDVARDRLSGV